MMFEVLAYAGGARLLVDQHADIEVERIYFEVVAR